MALMYLLLLIFGLICLFVGITSLRKARGIYSRGVKKEAVVVAIEETSFSGTNTRMAQGFHAIYCYEDGNGKEHRLTGNRKSTSRDNFALGERKTVIFYPQAPSEALDQPYKVYATSVVYLIGSIASIGVGLSGFFET